MALAGVCVSTAGIITSAATITLALRRIASLPILIGNDLISTRQAQYWPIVQLQTSAGFGYSKNIVRFPHGSAKAREPQWQQLRLFSIGRSNGEISFMMSRDKGRTKPTLIERDFPHHVEVIVRWAGSAFVSMPCTTGSVQRQCAVAAAVMRTGATTFGGVLPNGECHQDFWYPFRIKCGLTQLAGIAMPSICSVMPRPICSQVSRMDAQAVADGHGPFVDHHDSIVICSRISLLIVPIWR